MLKKWPFLDQNHGLTPLKKCQFFDFFNFFFYSLGRRFSFLEYSKTRFPGLYYIKKNLENWLFFDQSHGLTPLGKSELLEFLNVFFL